MITAMIVSRMHRLFRAGMTPREIARRCGCPEPDVYWLLFRLQQMIAASS